MSLDKLSKLSKSSKSSDKTSKNCVAATPYTTRGKAYSAIIKGETVYLLKTERKGKIITTAYSCCSKTSLSSDDLCHLHSRMNILNKDSLKIFTDIIPTDSLDKSKSIATINDEFFNNMGKRGARKKYIENNFIFKDCNDPVLLILNHKDAKLSAQLGKYASELLNLSIKKHSSKKPEGFGKLDNTAKVLVKASTEKASMAKASTEKASMAKANTADELSDESDESDGSDESDELSDESDELDEADGIDESNMKALAPKKPIYESDGEEVLDEVPDEASDDDPDGVPCIPINTNNGNLLWLNQETLTVYEPDGDDGGEEIGILTQISEEYHTVVYNKLLYTILKDIKINKGRSIYCCVITDALFDDKLNFIGSREKLENNTYKLNLI